MHYLKKNYQVSQKEKYTRFPLMASNFLHDWIKNSHRRSLRVASQQAGSFTPTDCLGLLQVCSWGVLSTCRWNWNYRVLILVLILLLTNNLVLCTLLVLLKTGSCAGVSTFPWKVGVEGETDAPGCLLLTAAVSRGARNSSGRWWCIAFLHCHQGQWEFGACCVNASDKRCKQLYLKKTCLKKFYS